MKTKLLGWLPILLVFAVTPVFAKKSKPISAPEPQSFQQLKSLQGNWVATLDMDGDAKKETVRLTYRTTSGGNALEEMIMAGSPQEMISVYHLDNGKILMTHYCMVGNQPRLQEVSSTKKEILLEKRDVTNMKSPNEMHMGGLKIVFKDKDHFDQVWKHYNQDGTTTDSVFEWTREK